MSPPADADDESVGPDGVVGRDDAELVTAADVDGAAADVEDRTATAEVEPTSPVPGVLLLHADSASTRAHEAADAFRTDPLMSTSDRPDDPHPVEMGASVLVPTTPAQTPMTYADRPGRTVSGR